MRVTFRTVFGGLDYINTAADQAARARQQVQSGKKIEKASDDPSGMQRSIEGRGEIRTLETYARSSDSAMARLTALDTVMASVVDKLTQAKVQVHSAQGSTATAHHRDVAALALEGIRDSLAGDLNTTFRGAYVFGGGEATTPPYARVAGVWTYQGDATPTRVDIGPGQTVDITLDGQALAQGTDTTNILNELEALIVAVRAGDQAGMANGTAALDRAFLRATRTQSSIGVDQQAIDERQPQISSTRLAIVARVAKDEDADLAVAISEMARAEAAYKAALGAVGTASRLTLMDYLR